MVALHSRTPDALRLEKGKSSFQGLVVKIYDPPPLGTYSVTRLLEYFSILAFENLPNKVKKLPNTKKQHLKFYQSGEILANLVSLIG